MKSKASIIIFITILFIKNSFGQEDFAIWVKIADKVVYIDDNPHTHFYFTFPGDTLMQSEENEHVLFTDSGEVIQVLKKTLTKKQNNKKYDSKKEKKILEWYKDYELNYQQKDYYQQKLENKIEYFTNKNGKNFLLWYFKIPEIKEDSNFEIAEEEGELVLDITFSHHMFLTFISNKQLVSISVSVPEGKLQDKIDFGRKLADNIYIYGIGLNPKELTKRETIEDENEKYFVSDERLDSLKIEVPEWMVIQNYPGYKTYPEFILLFTAYPDSCNIVNAMSVLIESKDSTSSFEDFNEGIIKVQNAISVEDSEIINKHGGISKKLITRSSFGGIFHQHYYTIKTEKYYIWISFTATHHTYDYNIVRHKEFLNGIRFE